MVDYVYSTNDFLDISYKINHDTHKLDSSIIQKIEMLKKLLNVKDKVLIKGPPIEFKATVIDKKEGIEKIINEIRNLLNKISEKTIDKYTITIIDKIKQHRDDLSSEEFKKLGDSIFSIACSNQFYVKLYSKLYKELIENFAFFTHIFNDSINNYLELFNKIESVNPNENYNKYCECIKINETRKTTSCFYVELMNLDILDVNIVEKIILNMQEKLIQNKEDESRLYENIEITENLYIFITLGKEKLKSIDSWNRIIHNINFIHVQDISSNKGLSNKIRFKHMDIIDNINT